MRDDTLEKVCEWAISHSLATGHADTLDELLAHLGEQVEKLRDNNATLVRKVGAAVMAIKMAPCPNYEGKGEGTCSDCECWKRPAMGG